MLRLYTALGGMKKGGTYMKKLTPLTLTFCLLLALTGCQKNTDSSGSGAVADQKGGSVYYLNFKPEVADVYQKIAEAYQKETGVELRVVTAASGTYEQTLKSEMAKLSLIHI